MTIYYQDDQTTVYHGDCIEVMRNLPENSVDAIVTDPPYGLSNTSPDQVADTIMRWVNGDREYLPAGKGFMGKSWDAFVPPVAVWDEAMRVLKPGGHVLAFAGTRTVDLMTLGLRLAGFEIRESLAWLFGSGMPKSHNISKALDKMAGAEREVIGRYTSPDGRDRSAPSNGVGAVYGRDGREWNKAITAPATDAAKQWEGWGTALKPAIEPIIMARKPFKSTIAANVLEHGTGALNIDATRVETVDSLYRSSSIAKVVGDSEIYEGWDRPYRHSQESVDKANEETRKKSEKADRLGRWPANVILDEHMAGVLDEQAPDVGNNGQKKFGAGDKFPGVYGDFQTGERPGRPRDKGGASRFFYIARKDNECPSGQSSSTVSTAEMSSSGEGQPPASAPNGAATSERHDTGKQTGSPSTSETQNGSKPNETTDTPTTPTIESVSSPERQHASTTLTRNPANSAEPNPQTDTMTTTTSHLKSAGSAESATSSTTQKSKELGDMDLGDSSRFMYCAKAPKRERPEVNGVKHATVKPLTLMRYLVRMVTPPGGIVLDPFAGSGTTIEAALLEGFQSIGIELTDEYLPLIQQRIQRQEVIE